MMMMINEQSYSNVNIIKLHTFSCFLYIYRRRYDGLAVEQWSRNRKVPVRNQVDAMPFGKALILITKSLGEDLKLLIPWLLTYKHTVLS